MTLTEKVLGGLSLVALLGGVGGIGRGIYRASRVHDQPKGIVRVYELEYRLSERITLNEVSNLPLTTLDGYKKLRDEHDKLISLPEIKLAIDNLKSDITNSFTGGTVSLALSVGFFFAWQYKCTSRKRIVQGNG